MHEGTVRLGRGTNWESLLSLGDATVQWDKPCGMSQEHRTVLFLQPPQVLALG